MCTVSYFKSEDKVIITSNRDENINRPLALPPQKIVLENTVIYCPIDPLHQGTWFGVNHSGSVFVLLNGAVKKHIPNPPYAKSRGLILLDMADSNDFDIKWDELSLKNIENFTLIVFSNDNLVQFRWDGFAKSRTKLDENLAHIWSSSTLYDEQTIKNREEWFFDFIKSKNKAVTSDDLFYFHTKTKSEDKKNGLIMNRYNEMLTKNVTQAIIYSDRFIIEHRDLITNQTNIYSIV